MSTATFYANSAYLLKRVLELESDGLPAKMAV